MGSLFGALGFSSNPEERSKIDAIMRSQAVIEFSLDGTVLTANQNFLDVLGYGLDEIAGQHHRMFCDPDFARGRANAEFWERLRAGDYVAVEF